MTYYFRVLKGESGQTAGLVLLFSIVGMAGSYAVAWYGIRINTYANTSINLEFAFTQRNANPFVVFTRYVDKANRTQGRSKLIVIGRVGKHLRSIHCREFTIPPPECLHPCASMELVLQRVPNLAAPLLTPSRQAIAVSCPFH
jgi:hypothetical protein